jgi:uncharacterized protein (TIGR02246 family)
MKKSAFNNSLIFLIFISIIFLGCTQKPADVTREISVAIKEFTETFNNGDAQALAMRYTSNAKMYPSNSDVIEGQEAIEGFWNVVMNAGIKKGHFETITAESFGNIAIEEGRYELYTEEDQTVDQGKYIVTWEKENGQWKLHRNIWNTSNPAPQSRAYVNDTVWVVWNHIKADKVSQFEDYNFNYLEPATAEYYPQMRSTTRILRPAAPNEDGTYTYFYLMDAATSPDRYDMMLPLTAKYGEEKANEYLKMFWDCLSNGYWERIVAVQTDW